ncbi:hypothetical protein O3M35_009291 [Rhynocoris fuscipes]|uniref:Uncharacterized protein n=1 Tax=Rhynocoris fuscipes TaxID=488301 RepID=A0AAW1D2C7_9HEMI
MDLLQFNNVVNDCGNILDLVLSSHTDIIVSISCDPLVNIDKFHPPLELIKINDNMRHDVNYPIVYSRYFDYINSASSYKDLASADFYSVSDSLLQVDWNDLSFLSFDLSSLKPEDLSPGSPEIKRNLQHQPVRLSSLKPEDLLPENPEIKRNLQHQPVM